MGMLSGKYFAADGGPPDARLNLFKGRYEEGESRYSLSKKNIAVAIKHLYLDILWWLVSYLEPQQFGN